MKSVRALMERGVLEQVFPGGVLLVARDSSILSLEAYGWADLFSRRKMTTETTFDLASLTKPLATTLAIFLLHQGERLHVDQPVAELLPDFREGEKGRITLRSLLVHESGLPAYRPYYLKLVRVAPSKRKARLRRLLAEETLESPVTGTAVYSDLGFMILEWVVETVSGMPFYRYMEESVYARMEKPAGGGLFFPGSEKAPRNPVFAATEFCIWRNRLMVGKVHDENAYITGEIGGHAGLFGNALDVWKTLSVLISDFRGSGKTHLFRRELLEMGFQPSPGGGKALGFDTPSPVGASCGRYFSKRTIGHLGFTGTSFWVDLDRRITVILLTNRIHPYRGNEKIRAFRPLLHDAVMEAIR